MSKERLYGWSGEMPVKELGGQAAIVFRGLQARPEELMTGHDWADIIGPSLRTRQDAYRVVLYYIIIFKGKGLIRTNEYDINATTRKDAVKHGITVRTNATIDERYSVVEPVTPTPEPEPPVDGKFWPDDFDVNATEYDTKLADTEVHDDEV